MLIRQAGESRLGLTLDSLTVFRWEQRLDFSNHLLFVFEALGVGSMEASKHERLKALLC